MKQSFGRGWGWILGLAILLIWQSLGFAGEMKPTVTTPAGLAKEVDLRWATHMKGLTSGTQEYDKARGEVINFEVAVNLAHDKATAGDYAGASVAAPLYRMKAWYTLNQLRKALGGKPDAKGFWTGYNVDVNGVYLGSPEQKVKCIALANLVIDYANAAQVSKLVKDSNGLDVFKATQFAQNFLNGILK